MTRLLLTFSLSLQIPTSIACPQVAIPHPHCSKNIPYSLALHIRRICSDDETFEKRVKDLSEHLNKQGYQKQGIDQALEIIRHIDRQNLLSYKPKLTTNKAVLHFVIAYHPDLPKVRGIVNKHRSIIESSDHLSTVFQ